MLIFLHISKISTIILLFYLLLNNNYHNQLVDWSWMSITTIKSSITKQLRQKTIPKKNCFSFLIWTFHTTFSFTMTTVIGIEPSTSGKAILHTSYGDVNIEFWPKQAPLAVRNFVQLSLEGYYNKTIFHRIIKDMMIQGGDPTGTGYGIFSISCSLFMFTNILYKFCSLSFCHSVHLILLWYINILVIIFNWSLFF